MGKLSKLFKKLKDMLCKQQIVADQADVVSEDDLGMASLQDRIIAEIEIHGKKRMIEIQTNGDRHGIAEIVLDGTKYLVEWSCD